MELQVLDFFCTVAEENPQKYRPGLIRDFGMTLKAFDHPVNCSVRARAFLFQLVRETLPNLHIESLFNLPSLINTLELDLEGDAEESMTSLLLGEIEAR